MTTHPRYDEGTANAYRRFGLTKLAEGEPPPRRKKRRRSLLLPTLAAGAATGLGAYYLMRKPTLSPDATKGFNRQQQLASQKGFHRVVDLSMSEAPPKAFGKTLGKWWDGVTGQRKKAPSLGDVADNALDHLSHWWRPKFDPVTREMGALDKAKLWLQEGDEAIPVGRDKHTGEAFVIGRPKGIKVKGLVQGRHNPPADGSQGVAHLIRGGVDLEGSKKVQKALTRMGVEGKGFEAELLQRYAPEAMPETITDISHYINGPAASGIAGREMRIRAIQKAMQADAKARGWSEFALKPKRGLQSNAEFPVGSMKWHKELRRYDKHMANPDNVKAYQAAVQRSDVDAVTYLKEHQLLPGHVLSETLRDPSTVIKQNWLPDAMGEWRVHVMNGHAPRSMMIPRYFTNNLTESLPDYADMGAVDKKELQHFIQSTMKKLPKKYRKGTYGMDVMPFRDKDGNVYFKIIELNPSERFGYMGSNGGTSGFLESGVVPWMGHAHYREVAGRHTRPAAALTGLGAGLGAAGMTTFLGHRRQDAEREDEERQRADDTLPHPAG